MKKYIPKFLILILIANVKCLTVVAQITSGRLQNFIYDKHNVNVKFYEQVKEFYSYLNYATAWIQKENTENSEVFFNIVQSCSVFGLKQEDYQSNYIKEFKKGMAHLQNAADSIEAEIRITAAAIHFFSDFAYGNVKPSLSYNGLNYTPDCFNIPQLLSDGILKKTLHELITHLAPVLPEVVTIENKIKFFTKIMAESSFEEIGITSNKATGDNKLLLKKLYQLGIVDSLNEKLTDKIIKEKIKEAQRQFNLLADGVLRSTSIQQLNVPLAIRLQQLNISLNYYRWLSCLMQRQSVIVVNIPATYLKVYFGNKVLLEMRMVVGKKSSPTPTLSSKIDEVILYPYWHVPFKIAVQELLPLLKRNPASIDEGNYQVLNSAGKIMNPYTIDWHLLNANNFPYTIRQSTGCDNALGLIKLNFYNPFDVYLHDTPNKFFFNISQRYLSHGCMRMEKPMQLGHLILKNNSIAIDTVEQKGCLRNQMPITVKADIRMPIIVWYNPAGVDNSGRVLYYEDVYEKFDWMKKK